MAWTLVITTEPGAIKPQSRARTGINGHFYSVASKPLKQWRSTLALEIKTAASSGLLPRVEADAVRFHGRIWFARPRSHYRADGKTLRPNAPKWPGKSKGDWDNLGKAITDELERSGVLANDGDIVDGRVCKWWAQQGESERAEIFLDVLD
jgi:Holliday junction resolvase RusA-like endonuclease